MLHFLRNTQSHIQYIPSNSRITANFPRASVRTFSQDLDIGYTFVQLICALMLHFFPSQCYVYKKARIARVSNREARLCHGFISNSQTCVVVAFVDWNKFQQGQKLNRLSAGNWVGRSRELFFFFLTFFWTCLDPFASDQRFVSLYRRVVSCTITQAQFRLQVYSPAHQCRYCFSLQIKNDTIHLNVTIECIYALMSRWYSSLKTHGIA